MYDSFDNMYQATIGIDFLSKASHYYVFEGGTKNHRLIRCRPCTSRTGQ